MPQELKLLLVEDSETDAGLVLRSLQIAGYTVSSHRVEDAESLTQALRSAQWDLIICDFKLPGFDAPAALRILNQTGIDIPFIVVSGTVGEETAVSMMRAGASDYVMKDGLMRLGAAVDRELCQAKSRKVRRDTELALLSNKAMLDCVVQSALDGVVLIDSAGIVELWNPAAQRIFGIPAEEAIGNSLQTLILPERHQQQHNSQLFPAMGNGDAIGATVEFTARRRDGSEFPVEWSIAKVSSSTSGQVVGVIRDITYRKRAEQALKDNEQRWQYALDSSGAAVWDLDFTTHKVFYTSAWKSMLGYSEDEIGSDHAEWSSRVHPDDMESIQQAFQAYLDGRAPVYESEHRLRAKDGSYRWIHCRAKVVSWDSQNKPVRMIGSHIDITSRKQEEEQKTKVQERLREAQRLESIGRLAGGIAHDFNNLLTVINGYSKLALQKMSASDPFRAYLQDIANSGERAATLVRQLLAFGRKQVMEITTLDINELITNVQKVLLVFIGTEVELIVDLQPNLPSICADRAQLENVIVNLALNGRDAMPNGGRLVISTSEVEYHDTSKPSGEPPSPGHYVRISVTDNGSGIPADVAPHIFEPFFTTKSIGKGTGLGLSTVHGIVMQSGGHISYESQIGKGTTFHVYLPALLSEVSPQLDPLGETLVNGSSKSGTVLVLETDSEVSRFIRKTLVNYGFKTINVVDPEQALAIIKKENVDLLLTDVVMPTIRGLDLAAKAKLLKPALRILFMSGFGEQMLVGGTPLSQAEPYIQKPFSPKALVSRISELLESSMASANILIVDDEPGIRRFLRSVLEEAGYRVFEAPDGKQALRQVREITPNLVITDLVMPEQEGIETIQQLVQEFPGTSIIAMSGASGGAYLHMTELLGAHGVLAKPISPEALLAEVERVLAPAKD